MSTKAFLPLNHRSKIVLYEKFPFYNLSCILPKEIYSSVVGKGESSWLSLLFTNYFTYNFKNIGRNHTLTLRTRAIFSTSSYLYIDTGTKYTVLKPKFKNFFTCRVSQLLQKELLILSYSFFFAFLGVSFIRPLLNNFIPHSIRRRYPVNNKSFFYTQFFMKKIIFIQNPLSKYFSLSKIFKHHLSLYQKKINFLQFTIFFKNINIQQFFKSNTHATTR